MEGNFFTIVYVGGSTFLKCVVNMSDILPLIAGRDVTTLADTFRRLNLRLTALECARELSMPRSGRTLLLPSAEDHDDGVASQEDATNTTVDESIRSDVSPLLWWLKDDHPAAGAVAAAPLREQATGARSASPPSSSSQELLELREEVEQLRAEITGLKQQQGDGSRVNALARSPRGEGPIEIAPPLASSSSIPEGGGSPLAGPRLRGSQQPTVMAMPLSQNTATPSSLAATKQQLNTIVRCFADRLPTIVSCVGHRHKESLIPMLVAIVEHHTVPSIRKSLLFHFFHLFRRPDAAQRQSIVEGLHQLCSRLPNGRHIMAASLNTRGGELTTTTTTTVAHASGDGASSSSAAAAVASSSSVFADRWEAEIMPELLACATHRYSELRCLALECLRVAAPFLTLEACDQALTSVLCGLNADPSSTVRALVADTLPVLWRTFSASTFAQAAVLTLSLMLDSRPNVVEAMHRGMPVILQCCLRDGTLLTHYAVAVASLLTQYASKALPIAGAAAAGGGNAGGATAVSVVGGTSAPLTTAPVEAPAASVLSAPPATMSSSYSPRADIEHGQKVLVSLIQQVLRLLLDTAASSYAVTAAAQATPAVKSGGGRGGVGDDERAFATKNAASTERAAADTIAVLVATWRRQFERDVLPKLFLALQSTANDVRVHDTLCVSLADATRLFGIPFQRDVVDPYFRALLSMGGPVNHNPATTAAPAAATSSPLVSEGCVDSRRVSVVGPSSSLFLPYAAPPAATSQFDIAISGAAAYYCSVIHVEDRHVALTDALFGPPGASSPLFSILPAAAPLSIIPAESATGSGGLTSAMPTAASRTAAVGFVAWLTKATAATLADIILSVLGRDGQSRAGDATAAVVVAAPLVVGGPTGTGEASCDALGAALARGARQVGSGRQAPTAQSSAAAARVVFDATWRAIEGSVNAPTVRISIVGVLLQVAAAVGEELAMSCAWPQVLVLSTDRQPAVRRAALEGMCAFATLVSTSQDKIFTAIFAVIESDGPISESMLTVLQALRERVSTTPSHAREFHVIPLVTRVCRELEIGPHPVIAVGSSHHHLAATGSTRGSGASDSLQQQQQVLDVKRRVVLAVMELVHALLTCPTLTHSQVKTELLPAVKLLQREVESCWAAGSTTTAATTAAAGGSSSTSTISGAGSGAGSAATGMSGGAMIGGASASTSSNNGVLGASGGSHVASSTAPSSGIVYGGGTASRMENVGTHSAAASAKTILASLLKDLQSRETRLKPYHADSGMSFFDKVKLELTSIVKA